MKTKNLIAVVLFALGSITAVSLSTGSGFAANENTKVNRYMPDTTGQGGPDTTDGLPGGILPPIGH